MKKKIEPNKIIEFVPNRHDLEFALCAAAIFGLFMAFPNPPVNVVPPLIVAPTPTSSSIFRLQAGQTATVICVAGSSPIVQSTQNDFTIKVTCVLSRPDPAGRIREQVLAAVLDPIDMADIDRLVGCKPGAKYVIQDLALPNWPYIDPTKPQDCLTTP